MKRVAALVLVLLAFFSCWNNRVNYRQELQEALDTSRNPLEMKGRLLELDQRVPGKAGVKINLGILCLTLGEVAEAGVYLTRAHELAYERDKAELTTEERYLLLSGLAEYSYKTKQLDEARHFAQQALEVDPEDSLGDRLIIARVDYRRRELEGAREAFRAVWNGNQRYMNKEDYDAFFVLLLDAEEWPQAYDVLRGYLQKFGYEYGLGVKTSALLEKTGKINASILAAFTDLRCGLFRGLIGRETIEENLEELGRRLQSGTWTHENRGEQVLSGLQHVLDDRWDEAENAFGDIAGGTDQSSPLVRFWFLVVQMENGHTESLAVYVEEESTLGGFPEYYYRLWRALKRRSSGYSLAKAKPILENAIQLSRGTLYSAESRRELGRLMGLSPKDSEWVLVGYEVQELAEKFQSTGELQYVEPMLRALGVENNDYTALAESVVRELAAGSADLRAYLLSRRDEAGGNLKLRLDNLLN